MTSKSIRNSNLEILRIISMVMVIASHYVGHGNFNWEAIPFSLQKVTVIYMGSGGRLAVAVFVLISGYFGCKSKFNVKRIIPLIVKTWLYSVIILVLMMFIIPNTNEIGAVSIIKHLLPNLFASNWFVTFYVVLYLISPYINHVIERLTQKQHLTLIITLSVLWGVLPSFTTSAPAYSVLGWFVTLYLIAAYLRLYPRTTSAKHHALLALFWAAVLFASELSIDYLSSSASFFSVDTRHFSEFNKIPCFMLAVELLLVFSKMKPRYSKTVNAIATTAFGIYLIHDNDYMRHFLWIDLFKNASYWGTTLFWVHFVGAVLIVFIACALIDFVVWEKALGKALERFMAGYFEHLTTSVTTGVNRLIDRFKRFV